MFYRYFQKMKFCLIAKMEQLGPFILFYTLSCADKRWNEMLATVATKKFKDLNVMYCLEERSEGRKVEDEELNQYKPLDMDSDEEVYVDPEEEVEIVENKTNEYFVHEKVPRSKNIQLRTKCHLHHYSDGFVCERTGLTEYFDNSRRKELLQDCVLDITRMFDRKVKSFRKNILMAPQSPMQIQYYQDRTEFQGRGNAHLHGAAWSNFEELEQLFPGITRTFDKIRQNKRLLQEDLKSLTKMAESSLTCTLNVEEIERFRLSQEDAEWVANTVKEVNKHHHTKSCQRDGKCRYNIPRFPSNYTIVAQVLPQVEGEEENKVREKLVLAVNFVQRNVKESLMGLEKEDLEVLQDISLDQLLEAALSDITCDGDVIIVSGRITKNEFKVKTVCDFLKGFSNTQVTAVSSRQYLRQAVYHYSLSVCDYGAKMVLKRSVGEICINNYNPHWMLAMNCNMDIQIPLDYFSIITYVTNYMTKPEKSTAEILSAVKKQKQKEKVSHTQLMYALVHAYLTSREMGECEAYYKLDPNLHYQESNIKTVFVASGFPENRQKFLRQAKEDNKMAFEIEGHEGKFQETQSIHDKYAMRPPVMDTMCLAQFSMWYSMMTPQAVAKVKEEYKDTDLNTVFGDVRIVVCGDTEDFPPTNNWELKMLKYIELDNNRMMRLRKYAAVLRRHKFKATIDPHEFFYSELLLFRPWRSETELHQDDVTMSAEQFLECDNDSPTVTVNDKKLTLSKIDIVKRQLFPHLIDVEEGREMVEKFDYDNVDNIGRELDPEGEMQNDEDAEAGPEDADEYLGLGPEGLEEQHEGTTGAETHFQLPDVIDMEALLVNTRQLVGEQQIVLNSVLSYCKDLRKYETHPRGVDVEPPLFVVHGGAGTGKSFLIKVISYWVKTLLTRPGDDVENAPYLVRVAPTGMAAANIDGNTLHATFSLPFYNDCPKLSDKKRDVFRDYFKNLRFVLCDEFSMLKSDQLFQIHERLCEIKQNNKEFGGVAVILFGDLLQLKPIQGAYIFQEPKCAKYREVRKVFDLWQMFKCVDLKVNHRQGDDRVYAELLNRLRFKSKGEDLSEDDLALLNSRVKLPQDPENATKIFGKNVPVNQENEKRLNQINSRLHTITATHLKDRQVKINSDGSIENTGFLDKLQLKKGARVMLIHNVNTCDGLVNGAQGTVQDILIREGKVRFVLVKFDNEKIGAQQKRKFKFLENVMEVGTAVPIEKVNKSYTLGDPKKTNGAKAAFIQMPLKCCWALTSHKVNMIFYIE